MKVKIIPLRDEQEVITLPVSKFIVIENEETQSAREFSLSDTDDPFYNIGF